MHGGKRIGSGRKKKPDHLKRERISIRLPTWLIAQLKERGEISYWIESHLVEKGDFDLPDDYDNGS